MRLNHINLTVSDVEAAKTFLKTYFGLRESGGERNKNRAFLHDDDGLVLSMFKGKDVTYPATFHIGFIQNSREDVDAIYARMTADGIVADPPRQLHGWTFYVNAPGGFRVEVLG